MATEIKTTTEETSADGGNAPSTTADTTSGDIISSTEMAEIVSAMKTVLDHTHIFYDDYGRNCNCKCTCTRGIL